MIVEETISTVEAIAETGTDDFPAIRRCNET